MLRRAPTELGNGAKAEVDALVVGAGPAGAAAAYHLARQGVHVLLADKASFPREKVCGDGLTPRGVRALERMGVDTRDPGFRRVHGLRVHGRGVTLELPWPALDSFPGYGLVRTRLDLDHLLVERARTAGAQLRERAEAVAPVMDRGWVAGARLRSAGDSQEVEVKARFVIAADGASSRFAGAAGVRRDPQRPLGIAGRRYFRLQRPLRPWFETWLDLWEGDVLLPGYGWIFPLPDGRANVGAGLLDSYPRFREFSARRVFDIFLRLLPRDWGLSEESAAGPLLSGPLPMGMNRRPLCVPGMLVTGDAGGIVNPFNGEGIAYAIESGELAADLVHEALAKDRPGLAHMYPTVLRQRYGRYFHIGRNFVRAIGKPKVMRFATKHGLPREWVMRFALRFMANLTDGSRGSAQDKLMYAIERAAPSS